jgi:hypothetical protein
VKEKITVIILSVVGIFTLLTIIINGISEYKHVRLNHAIVIDEYPNEINFNQMTYYKTTDLVDGYVLYEANFSITSDAFECMTDPNGNGSCFGDVRSHHYLLVNEDEKVLVKNAIQNGKVHGKCLAEVIEELRAN